jgi:hypothetical protein
VIISKKPPRNNYIIVTFDSCRYDSLVTARPKVMKKLGKLERRWSYASWTSPSHYNLLIGLMRTPAHLTSTLRVLQEGLRQVQRAAGCGRHSVPVAGAECICRRSSEHDGVRTRDGIAACAESEDHLNNGLTLTS